MTRWFEDFKYALRRAGYVRLIAHFPVTTERVFGNLEAFYYKERKEPRDSPNPFDRPTLWRIVEVTPELHLGCGNGRSGVHQCQVDTLASRVPAAIRGVTVHDLLPKVDAARLVHPIFMEYYKVTCKCGYATQTISMDTRVNYNFVCDSCTQGDL